MIHPVDIVALVILLITWVRGLRRGVLRSLFDVFRTVVAYWAAWRYARPAGTLVSAHVHVAGAIAIVVGAVAVFFLVQVGFCIVESLLGSLRRDRGGKTAHSFPSRFLGGLIGLCIGAVSVVVLCWLYGAARASIWGERLPSGEASRTIQLSKAILSRGAYAVVRDKTESPERAHRIARMVSDPEQTTNQLRAVVQDQQIADLVADSAFTSALRDGDTSGIMANPRFEALLSDDVTMRRLADLGLVPADWRTAEFRAAMASQLAGVGQRMTEILDDPETRATIAELQREGLWQPDKLLQLTTDSRFLRLVDRVMATGHGVQDTLEALP